MKSKFIKVCGKLVQMNNTSVWYLLPIVFFPQEALFYMLAPVAVAAQAQEAHPVGTRPSRPPHTHSLHPQRRSPSQRLAL